MNRLHNARRNEARLEDQLQNLLKPPAEPELAADWALRKELARLKPEPLPPAFRHRVLSDSRRFRLRWASGMAMAASISMLLLFGHLIQQPQNDITRSDAQNFQLAMQTISTTSQRALNITGRELDEHVRMPTIAIDDLPYSSVLQAMIAAPTESELTKEN